MKILFINPLSAYMRGGGEINDLNLAKALQSFGHDVKIIDVKDPKRKTYPYPEHITSYSVEMPFFYDKALKIKGQAGKLARAFFFWLFLFNLKRQLKSVIKQADLILLTGKPLLADITKWTNAKTMLSIRGKNRRYMYPKYKVADSVIFWGGCHVDHPQSLLDTLAHVNLDPAIQNEYFKPGPADPKLITELSLGHKAPVKCLYVGRLDPVHQVDMIIRAFESAHKSTEQEMVLNIVGGGADMNELQELANDIAPKHIKFWGRMKPKDIARFHHASDIFIINPRHTNHPIALKEGVACQSFCLAPSLGRVEQILHGYDAAIMFEPNNLRSLSSILNDVVTEKKYNKGQTPPSFNNTWHDNAGSVLEFIKKLKERA